MRSFAFLMLTLPLVSLLSLSACGDEAAAPTESAPASSQNSGSSGARPAERERTTVEINVPRPPSVTVTPPQPGSVEVN
jgi:hypothetical protein